MSVKQRVVIRNYQSIDNDKGTEFTDLSMTQQQFKDECNINNIVARFYKTGEFPPIARHGFYADIPDGVESYQDALTLIQEADEQFMLLPATIRDKFDNDPSKLVEYIDDPANYAEAVSLGILSAPAGVTPNVRMAPDVSPVGPNPDTGPETDTAPSTT